MSDENKTTLLTRVRGSLLRFRHAARNAGERLMARARGARLSTNSTNRTNLWLILVMAIAGAVVITAVALLLVSPHETAPQPKPTPTSTSTATPTATPTVSPTPDAYSPVSLPSGVQLSLPDSWKGVPAAGVDLAFQTPAHVGDDELVTFTDLGALGKVTVPLLDETVNALTASGGSATAPTVNADGIGSFTVTGPNKTIYVWVSLVSGHGVLTTLTLDQADQQSSYAIADLVAALSRNGR